MEHGKRVSLAVFLLSNKRLCGSFVRADYDVNDMSSSYVNYTCDSNVNYTFNDNKGDVVYTMISRKKIDGRRIRGGMTICFMNIKNQERIN